MREDAPGSMAGRLARAAWDSAPRRRMAPRGGQVHLRSWVGPGLMDGCLHAGTQEAKIADGVGAVGELVDRTGERQVADMRVGDRLLQRGGEPDGANDLVRPVMEAACPRVQRWGESQLVVPGGDSFAGLAKVVLAGASHQRISRRS